MHIYKSFRWIYPKPTGHHVRPSVPNPAFQTQRSILRLFFDIHRSHSVPPNPSFISARLPAESLPFALQLLLDRSRAQSLRLYLRLCPLLVVAIAVIPATAEWCLSRLKHTSSLDRRDGVVGVQPRLLLSSQSCLVQTTMLSSRRKVQNWARMVV